MSSKKICLITPSIHMGGMQRAMVNLSNELNNCGYAVNLIALFKLEHFFELNKDISFVEPNNRNNEEGKIKTIIRLVNYIKSEVVNSGCTKVLVYGRYYSALTLFVLRGLNINVFISDRASPQYRDYWYVELVSRCINIFFKPTGVIAQTETSLLFQRKKFGDLIPMKVIPNALKPIKLIPDVKKNQVLVMGRIEDKLKGIDRLISAWCKTNNHDWKLVIAGGDDTQGQNLGFIDELTRFGKRESVVFLGKVSNIDRLLSESKIFVIPSRSEGFPNALLEALAAKLYCISFDFVAGPRDLIIHDKTGVIVEDGNISKLTSAIEEGITDKSKRERISNENNHIDTYRSDRIVKKLIKFIEQNAK